MEFYSVIGIWFQTPKVYSFFEWQGPIKSVRIFMILFMYRKRKKNTENVLTFFKPFENILNQHWIILWIIFTIVLKTKLHWTGFIFLKKTYIFNCLSRWNNWSMLTAWFVWVLLDLFPIYCELLLDTPAGIRFHVFFIIW